jgi:trans-2,3-dihydro-3-hydroxyanthranilate isomerase
MTATGRVRRFVQVDVFTDTLFGGNPLAVLLDGQGLSDTEMQAIAREMNHSETTFVLPAKRRELSASIRIFTPWRELPFAGHPTIGTAWTLLSEGLVDGSSGRVVLGEGIGPVPVRFEGEAANPSFLWMDQGIAQFQTPGIAAADIAPALGLTAADLIPELPIEIGTTGVPFLLVPLRDPAAVDRVEVCVAELRACVARAGEASLGAVVFAQGAVQNEVYTRMLAPVGGGIFEDPATGSASGPLGAYVVRHRLASGERVVEMISRQGVAIGRPSEIHIRVELAAGQAGRIEVGGQVVPVLRGELRLP